MSTWEWKELCEKEHMHRWERSATTTNLVCTAEPRDNPEPQDAYVATVFCSVCKQPAKLRHGEIHYSEGGIKSPVCYGGCDIEYLTENIEWVSVKAPLITTLAGMVAAAKNQIAAEIESSVMRDLPRDPTGFSAVHPLSRGQVGDNKLHLYGSMTNYNMVMQYKTST